MEEKKPSKLEELLNANQMGNAEAAKAICMLLSNVTNRYLVVSKFGVMISYDIGSIMDAIGMKDGTRDKLWNELEATGIGRHRDAIIVDLYRLVELFGEAKKID